MMQPAPADKRGPRDAAVSHRDRLEGDLGAMPIDQAPTRLQQEISERRVRKTYSGSAGLEAKAAGHEY
jgi:threonyl-tRNA synthetase